MGKLKIDLEHLDFYEIDLDNPPFSEEGLSEDQVKELNDKNDKWIDEALTTEIVKLAGPCACRMLEFQQKHMRKAQLLNAKPGEYMPALDQEDVDAYHYGVVVSMQNGLYNGIQCIIRECKRCHHIDIFGRSEVLTRLFAETFTHFEDNQAAMNEQMNGTDTEDVNVEDVPELGDLVAETIEEVPENTEPAE